MQRDEEENKKKKKNQIKTIEKKGQHEQVQNFVEKSLDEKMYKNKKLIRKENKKILETLKSEFDKSLYSKRTNKENLERDCNSAMRNLIFIAIFANKWKLPAAERVRGTLGIELALSVQKGETRRVVGESFVCSNERCTEAEQDRASSK